MTQPPLILALTLDDASFAYFNALRKAHFPPAINYLDAHLTLFHHLPDVPAVTDLLRTVAGAQPPVLLEVTGLMKLGRGVAFRLACDPLVQLQAYLKWQWREWLTPQDQQGFRPHITVQNKVNPATANALYEELSAAFEPFTATGTGLSLWEYHNGPWRKREDFGFTSSWV
jgi:2'-5' RNA ligase